MVSKAGKFPRPPRAQARSPNWFWSSGLTVAGAQRREGRVEAFDHLSFTGEIAVFAFAVRLLDVHEKEIVVLPNLRQGGELVFWGLASELDHFHAHQLRHSPVHGIN